mgnify:CR=1 FL=1
MVNNHNVLITMLRKDFKALDHIAHARYDEDVYGPLDDAAVYENKNNRKLVHVVFEDFPWMLDDPCVHFVENFLEGVPSHIAISEIGSFLIEVTENHLGEDDSLPADYDPCLDGEFWKPDGVPMSDDEIRA